MRLALAVLLLSAVTTMASAEASIEYGDIPDLRGVKVIFIDSGLNLAFRSNAIAALKKELPALRVAEKQSEAEITLTVAIDGSDRGHGEAVMVV